MKHHHAHPHLLGRTGKRAPAVTSKAPGDTPTCHGGARTRTHVHALLHIHTHARARDHPEGKHPDPEMERENMLADTHFQWLLQAPARGEDPGEQGWMGLWAAGRWGGAQGGGYELLASRHCPE